MELKVNLEGELSASGEFVIGAQTAEVKKVEYEPSNRVVRPRHC